MALTEIKVVGWNNNHDMLLESQTHKLFIASLAGQC
jgi:hypothetical protein